MKVLVTGATGFLGRYLVDELSKNGTEFIGLNSKLCDLTDRQAVKEVIESYDPTHIIHAAAYTDVANAHADMERAYALNVTASRNLAWAKSDSCHLIYISTDAVYSGEGPHNIRNANPVGYYGLTKYLGELEVLAVPRTTILRTCFYGRTTTGRGLIQWLIKASKSPELIRIFHNHLFSPLHARTAARKIIDAFGLYDAEYRIHNLACANGISKAVFLCHAAKLLALPTNQFVVEAHHHDRDLRMAIGGHPWGINIMNDMRINLKDQIC